MSLRGYYHWLAGTLTGAAGSFWRRTGVWRSTAFDGLIEPSGAQRAQIDDMWPTDDIIRTREEFGRAAASAGRSQLKSRSSMAQISAPGGRRPRSCSMGPDFGYLGAD